MALIRWNPWRISDIFDDDFEMPTLPMLNRLGQGLNLYEDQDSIVAEAALPGIKEDQIDVTLDNGVVRVTATTQDKQEEKSQRRYFMSSVASSYNYSFRIPENLIEEGEPEAELENGVLKLKFKKVQKTPPKKVKVLAKTAPKQT